MVNVSIIVCTYNPDERVFRRCLKSIGRLERGNLSIECIVVDNNSSSPVAEMPFVVDFVREFGNAQVLVERAQGQSFARVCGFNASQGNLVVFFDDDNEPDTDYLLEAMRFSHENESVGAFGPGRVEVEFIDGAEEWLFDHKGYFQEADIEDDLVGDSPLGFPECNPFGTGIVLKRPVLEAYSRLVRDKGNNTTGRKGRDLASADDLQMVWLAIKFGFAVGKTPNLRLKHLIIGRKANRDYVRKFLYSGAKSYLPARLDVFPEEKAEAQARMLPSWRATVLCLWLLLKGTIRGDADFMIAGQAGSIAGYCSCFNKKVPRIVRLLKQYFGF